MTIDKNLIDELMYNTIVTLNEKGYTTKYCCQGHPEKDYIYIYIKFEYLHMHEVIKSIKNVRLPRGFEFFSIDTVSFFVEGGTYETYEERKEIIIKKNKALERWAKRLPPITITDNK